MKKMNSNNYDLTPYIDKLSNEITGTKISNNSSKFISNVLISILYNIIKCYNSNIKETMYKLLPENLANDASSYGITNTNINRVIKEIGHFTLIFSPCVINDILNDAAFFKNGYSFEFLISITSVIEYICIEILEISCSNEKRYSDDLTIDIIFDSILNDLRFIILKDMFKFECVENFNFNITKLNISHTGCIGNDKYKYSEYEDILLQIYHPPLKK